MRNTTGKPQAFVERRSQSPQGTWPRQGPDTYVAVQIVPPGARRLKTLNESVARKRGIEIIFCGEGYRNRCGPRSALGKAFTCAKLIAEKVNR